MRGVRAYVGGDAAVSLDQTQIYTDGMARVLLFVLGLSFVLLVLVFHSIAIPIKAILLNLLATGAAFGALVLVFEEGWFGSVLGIRPTSVVQNWVPIFIFTILFGLSMDYEVFILSRVKEAFDSGLESNEAVARGLTLTAGTVTSAAAIMVVVFAIFLTLPLAIARELGLGLAVAVFVDATVIRCVLLPATMKLLGDWNWWMPSFLRLAAADHDRRRDERRRGRAGGRLARRPRGREYPALRHWGPPSMTSTIALSARFRAPSGPPSERIAPMVDHPAPAVRDYYELGDDASEAGEPFVKWLPAMRLYGFVVLAVALVAATPWASPGGWRGAAAVAIVAVVAVVFSFMWVYRPDLAAWRPDARLARPFPGGGLRGARGTVAGLRRAAAPDLPAGRLLAGRCAGRLPADSRSARSRRLVVLAGAGGDIQAALPGMAGALLTAGMVVALAMWIRETIAQSLERRSLIDQLNGGPARAGRGGAGRRRGGRADTSGPRDPRHPGTGLRVRGDSSGGGRRVPRRRPRAGTPARHARPRKWRGQAWRRREPWSGLSGPRPSRRPDSRRRSNGSLRRQESGQAVPLPRSPSPVSRVSCT